jgi:hypothetical protein
MMAGPMSWFAGVSMEFPGIGAVWVDQMRKTVGYVDLGASWIGWIARHDHSRQSPTLGIDSETTQSATEVPTLSLPAAPRDVVWQKRLW